MRKLVILCCATVAALAIGAAYFLWPKPAQLAVPEPVEPTNGEPVLAVLGDSYASGYAGFGEGMDGWPVQVAAELGYGLELNAQPGTGYVTTIDRGTSTFPERAAESVKSNPDVVVVAGSRNDWNAEPTEVEEAARNTLASIDAAAPDAEVIVIGPMWAGDMPAGAQAVEDAVRAAAVDAGAEWIDGSDWLDSHPDKIADDNVHPNNAGHEVLAERIAEAIQ